MHRLHSPARNLMVMIATAMTMFLVGCSTQTPEPVETITVTAVPVPSPTEIVEATPMEEPPTSPDPYSMSADEYRESLDLTWALSTEEDKENICFMWAYDKEYAMATMRDEFEMPGDLFEQVVLPFFEANC